MERRSRKNEGRIANTLIRKSREADLEGRGGYSMSDQETSDKHHALVRRFVLLVCVLFMPGCATPKSKELVLLSATRSFELPAPVQTASGQLPPGEYFCQYENELGYFCEAPASLNPEYLFSMGGAGGIYITRTNPAKYFLFQQDKHPTSMYTLELGIITYGGSGKFKVGEELISSNLTELDF